LMLVSLTGRTTGRHYEQPVGDGRDGDALPTPGGGRWTLNLVAGRAERGRRRGRDVFRRPALVRGPVGAARLPGVVRAKNRMVERFAAVPEGAAGRDDRTRLDRAIRHGFCVVRRSPEEPTATEPTDARQGRRSVGTSPRGHRWMSAMPIRDVSPRE